MKILEIVKSVAKDGHGIITVKTSSFFGLIRDTTDIYLPSGSTIRAYWGNDGEILDNEEARVVNYLISKFNIDNAK